MTSCKNKFKVYYCGQKSKRYRYNVYYRSPNLINMGCKGAFVLGENYFRKSFSPKPACLAATENEIFRKFTSC